MGTKFNQKTGYWEASHSTRHPITRMPKTLRRTRLKSLAEAKRMEKQLAIEVHTKLHRDVVPVWARVVDEYLNNCLNVGFSNSTVENYRYCLQAYTYQIWGTRTVDLITTDEIRQLVLQDAKSKSVSHQRNILKFIRGAFKYAVEKGYIQRNHTPQLKFRIGDKIRNCLTQEQVRKFLEAAKEFQSEWYSIWTMAVYTGMRNGELFALTWDKISLDERTIKVDTSWNNKDGFKSTKSGDDRIVEIAPNLVTILRELKIKSENHPFVLPRVHRWEDGYQAQALRQFLIGVGLPSIRFHDLRATWATLLLSKGVAPIKVMSIGGWKDLKTMMVYMR